VNLVVEIGRAVFLWFRDNAGGQESDHSPGSAPVRNAIN